MDIAKLPKWAQEYIRDIERQRDVAIRTLNEARDTSTPSSIYYEANPCTGEDGRGPQQKRFYIQNHAITIEAHGIEVNIMVRGDCIDLVYHGVRHTDDVLLQPVSFQGFHIKPIGAGRMK